MSVRQLTQTVESFRTLLNTLQQQVGELPQTKTQSEQISQTFAALHTLISECTTQPPTEERFSTSEYELQALFHEALDAMLIADDAGSYVDANPAACELLGLPREEILTKSVGDFLEPGVDFSQRWQWFLEQGRIRSESRVLRPDGTVRETEYAAVANFVPHRHLSILRDITKRKRLETERNQIEAKLQQKQRFIEQIAESMPAILYVYDLYERRNVYANRQLTEILGYSAETIQVGGTEFVQTLIHPDDKHKVAEIFQQLAKATDGEVVEGEYRMRDANGEWRWLHIWNMVMNRNADRSPRQVVGTATDITRIKQTEQELRQSQAKFRALNEALEQRVAERTATLTREMSDRLATLRECQRLEEELRASQQKYKTLFEILPVGISITDPEGNLLEINQASEEILGISTAEHIQRRYDDPQWQIVRPDGSAMPCSEYASVLALAEQRVVQNVEMGVVKPNGKIAWLCVTAAPIPLESYGVAIAYMDITQRKQAEITLRQNEEQLRLVTDSLPVCISYVDKEQRYRFVNKTYETWFGCNRDKIYGITVREFLGEAAYSVVQQYNERVLAGDTVYYESEVPYRLGSTRYISATLVPDFDAQSQVRGLYALITDITARKQVEMQLVQTRNFLQLVLDHLPIAVFAKETSNLRFVLWNPACTELMGYTTEEVLNKTAYEVFSTQHAEFCTAKDQEVLATSQMVEILEGLIWTKQGEPKIVRNKKLAIYDPQGNPQFVLGFAEDITQRKRAEDKLRASLQEKEVLLAEIHHRVKNNLYVICSLLELQIDQLSDLQAKAALEDSCNRVSSMALVHENLYRTHNFSEIDFANYIQQLASDLLESYKSPECEVTLNFESNPVFLSLDQAIPCGLVLNELITNALKHCCSKGSSEQVYIRMTSIANGLIEIAVGNDGDRLPPDFDIQRNASMGLKLVIMLVEQLSGSLELERGELTWFKVQFPASLI